MPDGTTDMVSVLVKDHEETEGELLHHIDEEEEPKLFPTLQAALSGEGQSGLIDRIRDRMTGHETG